MTPANATIRGRIWRSSRINITAIGDHAPRYIDGGWGYEVRDRGKLLVRGSEATQQQALGKTCRHIRLAHEMAGS